MKKISPNESGRSMIEMLGVLAIIGVLSVVAIAGYNNSINKAKANKVIYDGRVAHTLSLSKNDAAKTWVAFSDFTPESNKTFSYLIDAKGNRYIKVDEIEEPVCKQMLQLKGSSLNLYTPENVEFTDCEENNNIVIDFDNHGVITECLASGECEGDSAYCSNGKCGNCENGREVNEEGNGCLCDTYSELTCSDEEGNTWCCGTNDDGNQTICGTTQGDCKESDGYCSYTMTAPVQKSTLEATCSYTMTAAVQKSTLEATCSYTMTAPVQTSTLEATCSYTMSQSGDNVSLTSVDGCPSGQYCYLKYSGNNCATSITNSGYTGTIYGVCIAQTSTNSQCLEKSSVTTGGLSVSTPCPSGQYCYLKYSGNNCATSITNSGYTGTIYGVCIAQTSTNSQCLEKSSETTGGLSVETPCPSGQYCYLKYSEDNCSASITNSGYTGTIYGVCVAQTSTNSQCLEKSSETTGGLSANVTCPAGEYCYLKYSAEKNCSSSISNSGYSGQIYGVCTPQTSYNAVCPVSN